MVPHRTANIVLVEKAQATFDEAQAGKMQEKLRKADVNLEDFLEQMQQFKKMGPLENVLGMLPGMSNIRDLSVEQKQLKRMEAIIQSMTLAERKDVDLLQASRKRRIAAGAGVDVADVNRLIKQFLEMQKVMKQVQKLGKTGFMRSMMPRFGGGVQGK